MGFCPASTFILARGAAQKTISPLTRCHVQTKFKHNISPSLSLSLVTAIPQLPTSTCRAPDAARERRAAASSGSAVAQFSRRSQGADSRQRCSISCRTSGGKKRVALRRNLATRKCRPKIWEVVVGGSCSFCFFSSSVLCLLSVLKLAALYSMFKQHALVLSTSPESV